MKSTAENSVDNADMKNYSFLLFVVRGGSNSARAHRNLKQLCEKYLPGRHTIKTVDVMEDFQTALQHNILLTPTILVKEPKPEVIIYGDLSDPQNFVNALNITEGDLDE